LRVYCHNTYNIVYALSLLQELVLQNLYKKSLTLYGFQIIGIANNGEEAVIMFKSFSKRPDIILMDYRMPIKNGIETIKAILQINDSSRIKFKRIS